jgi:hypothetical protein
MTKAYIWEIVTKRIKGHVKQVRKIVSNSCDSQPNEYQVCPILTIEKYRSHIVNIIGMLDAPRRNTNHDKPHPAAEVITICLVVGTMYQKMVG